jgi:hypothetical protein
MVHSVLSGHAENNKSRYAVPNPRLEAGTLQEPAHHRPGEAILGELQVFGPICNCFGT